MISKSDYEALSIFIDRKGDWFNAANLPDGIEPSRAKHLADGGFLLHRYQKTMFGNLPTYTISPQGEDAILAYEQAADEYAANKINEQLQKQREDERDRKDTIRLVLEVVGIIVSFVSGVVLQSSYDLLGFLKDALRLLGAK